MKKRNILTLILVLIIILFKIDVNAATCTTTEKSNLKKLARMIEINAVLDSEESPTHDHYYFVNLTNFSDNFYIIDSDNTRFEYDSTYNETKRYGAYMPGRTITFTVYGALGKNCAFERLATIRVNFPFYNDYYLSPSCEGIEDFYLCQKHYSGAIESELWFEQQVEKYKKSLDQQEPIEENKTGIIEKTTQYIKENPIVIIAAVVVFIFIVMAIITKIKENKKKIKINLELK